MDESDRVLDRDTVEDISSVPVTVEDLDKDNDRVDRGAHLHANVKMHSHAVSMHEVW